MNEKINKNNNNRTDNRELDSTETWFRDQLYKLLAWGGSALIVFAGVLASIDKNDEIFSLIRTDGTNNNLTINQIGCSIVLIIIVLSVIIFWSWGLLKIRNKFSNDEYTKDKFPKHSTVLPMYIIKTIVIIISSVALFLTFLAVVD